MTLTIEALDHLVLNVDDIEASASWYERVLGMRRVEVDSRTGKRTALEFGAQKINLRPARADIEAWITGGRPVPGSADLCFVTTIGSEAVAAHLRECGVPIEAGPVERTGARGPMRSVYCRDPDGNLIEIATYP